MKKRTLSKIYEAFSLGNHIEDDELEYLLTETNRTIEYFEARGDGRLVVRALYSDVNMLRNMKFHRENRG